jgi:hypothetical protein
MVSGIIARRAHYRRTYIDAWWLTIRYRRPEAGSRHAGGSEEIRDKYRDPGADITFR